MISESARSTTAAESRFRVQAPNAAARRILVIGLCLLLEDETDLRSVLHALGG
jgi:hypothetical protein